MSVEEKDDNCEWSREQHKAFENAIATHTEDSEDRWEKIAAEVPGKTIEEVQLHYEVLLEDIDQIESGCVPLPSYASPEGLTSDAPENGKGKKGSETNHGGKASKADQERRKGIAWTEDEHRRLICSAATELLPKKAGGLNMETPKEIFHKKPVHYTVDLNSRQTHALSRITALPGNEGSSPMVLTDTYRNLICFKVNGDDLEGSFKSSGYFCTQCGAEALFKITSSQDGKHFAVCEDLFNVFVVPDCNMGAMEKMSLIIFNSKIVLAIPETATETDYDYFRNYWTDNRVTCWDYLQGVEVVRMHETLLCSQGFHKGTDLYFKRLDGQAVTCKDLYYAMRNANDVAFSNFFHLHLQARTPTVGESSCFDAKKQTFTLSISSQEGQATRGQSVKMPICIPVAIGFLESGGKDMVFLSVLNDSRMELGEVQKHKEVEWEKLPGELWEEIGKRLESRLEVDRFRSVCKSWRSVLSAWNRFPLHVPSPPGASKFESENHPCFIIQHTVYLIDGQFFVLEEIDQGGLFTVASSRYKNIEYVCKDAASHFLHSVVDNNHVYSHLSCVSTSYHLRSATPTFDKKGIRIQGGRAFRRRDRYIRKIVLVSKNIAINPTYASDIDLVAMALLDDG